MTFASLASVSFASPWLLAGLAALPVLWWLLRLTPPRPETLAFPPASLLLGLRSRERTPVRSPWWLTLLRILIAAGIILALAGPFLKPPSTDAAALSRPVLVVVDNGWASGSRWAVRKTFATQIAEAAETSGQTLYLVATAGTQTRIEPLTPAQFRQRFASLEPQAFGDDRSAAAQRIELDLGAKAGQLKVAWLCDGVDAEGTDALKRVLASVSIEGAIDFYGDSPGAGALGISQPRAAEGQGLRASVFRAEQGPRAGQVAALTARGERLALVPFEIAGSQRQADISIALPLELRNQVARLEIAGEQSAGAVFLLDGRSQRRRVGLIASEGAEDAQPLLSPVYYLERALAPFADVTRGQGANLEKATAEVLGSSPSVLILADVGRLTGATRERVRTFVEKGGMLIRFAGPRLEQGGDPLLPVPLREGGRTLGGVLTWTSPEAPAPFEPGSLFDGLSVPKDVTISRQVLADPAAMAHDVQVWARLKDGTPLVTAAKRGAGQLVFFHITANPDWSNLPISGLFVEMMRKILETAPLAPVQETAPSTPDTAAASTLENTVLKPWRVLDGFGKLSEPGERAQPIAAANAPTRATAAIPAGLYGPQNAVRALNVLAPGDSVVPIAAPSNAKLRVFEDTKTIAFAPWLFLASFALFVLDAIVCAVLLSAGSGQWRRGAATAAVGLVLFSGAFAPSAKAQPEKPVAPGDATAFALRASLETRLAYVVTGDAEADRISQAGLTGLSKILTARTAVEPGEPMGIDPSRDELVFFPLIYWPVLPNADPLKDNVLAKIDAYMKQGGLIIFDTKSSDGLQSLTPSSVATPLAQLLGKLDLPPFQRVSEGHVLTKSFYLLQSFPGRWDNGDPWVEAPPETADAAKRGVKTDGVSSILITSNDLAAAWALDDSDRPMFAVVPGGDEQREMAFRFGVNIVMYALTGNYKSDQVHVPAILERLGH